MKFCYFFIFFSILTAITGAEISAHGIGDHHHPQVSAPGPDWKFIRSKDDIRVYSKSTEKSKIKELRADGEVKASIGKVLALLRNVENAINWVPDLAQRSYLKTISDTEAILFDVTKMPWPVANRELILHYKLEFGKNEKQLVLSFESTDAVEKSVQDGNVRAQVFTGKIFFTPLKDNSTWLEMYLHIDPKGEIPTWLVNLLQVQMPHDLIKAIRENAPSYSGVLLPGIKKMGENK